MLEYAVLYEEVRHAIPNEIETFFNGEFEGNDPKANCDSYENCSIVLVGEFADTME